MCPELCIDAGHEMVNDKPRDFIPRSERNYQFSSGIQGSWLTSMLLVERACYEPPKVTRWIVKLKQKAELKLVLQTEGGEGTFWAKILCCIGKLEGSNGSEHVQCRTGRQTGIKWMQETSADCDFMGPHSVEGVFGGTILDCAQGLFLTLCSVIISGFAQRNDCMSCRQGLIQ